VPLLEEVRRDVELVGDVFVPIGRVGSDRDESDDRVGILQFDFLVSLGDPTGKLAAVRRIDEDVAEPGKREPQLLTYLGRPHLSEMRRQPRAPV